MCRVSVLKNAIKSCGMCRVSVLKNAIKSCGMCRVSVLKKKVVENAYKFHQVQSNEDLGWRRVIKERRTDCLKAEVILKLKYRKKMRFRGKDEVGGG